MASIGTIESLSPNGGYATSRNSLARGCDQSWFQRWCVHTAMTLTHHIKEMKL